MSSTPAPRSQALRVPVAGPPVRPPRRVLVRLLLSASFCAPLAGLGAVAMLRSAEPLLMAAGLVVAVFVLYGCALVVLVVRSYEGRIDVAQGRLGLELHPAARARWAGPVLFALGGAFAVILVLGGVTGVDLGSSRFTSPAVGVLLLVALVVGLFTTPPSPSAVPWVVVAPDGVGRRRGQRTRLIDWDEVDAPRLVTTPAVKVVVWKRDARLAPVTSARDADQDAMRIEIPVRLYRSDPRLVLALIEHYRAHPGDRGELAGPEAIDRLRRGDLDPLA